MRSRIANFMRRERPEKRLGEQHHACLFVDDEAGSLLIGEFRVEPEAQFAKELFRPPQVSNGKVDEYFSRLRIWHGPLSPQLGMDESRSILQPFAPITTPARAP